MENMRIRRRRANYFLPSERVDLLNQMVGKSIKKFELGINRSSKEVFFQKNNVTNFSDLIYKSRGGPFIISLECDQSFIFYDDDLLGSIVFRQLSASSGNDAFFENLEREDKVGAGNSVKNLIELSIECGFSNEIIERISIYRLPINFIRNPHVYDLLNECIICFGIQNVGDILLVCEINESNGPPDIRVSTWDRMEEHFVKNLFCVWSSAIRLD